MIFQKCASLIAGGVLGLLCLATSLPAQQVAPVTEKKLETMAVVNGERISRQQLAQDCLQRYGNDMVESMVHKHLILTACNQQGIKVTEQQINDEIKSLAGKFGLSVDLWLKMLKEERQISPDQYKREIIWPSLALRALAAGKITVTNEELRAAFETEYGPRVKCRMISHSSDTTAEELHRKATANPAEFEKLAKDFSQDRASASAHGLIPPIRMHASTPELEQVAFALKEGEVSRVVQVAGQYVILKCEQQIKASYIPPEQLKQAEADLQAKIRDTKLRDVATNLFAELKQAAKVEIYWTDLAKRKANPGVAAKINGYNLTVNQLAEECLSRHGKEVLEGEVNRVLLKQAIARRGVEVTKEAMDAEVSRAAVTYGYLKQDGSPDFERWLQDVTNDDKMTVDLYLRDAVWPSVALKLLVKDQVKVTNEDLKKAFAANFGERVETLAIVCNDQRQAQKVWDMARSNKSREFFEQLARQYSIEPISRANGGRVPPIRQFGGQPTLEEAAFKLTPGELSGLIVQGDKYFLLHCLGRTDPVVKDFELVKNELYRDIHEKKLRIAMREQFDELKAASQLDNFLTGVSQSPRSAVRPASGTQPIRQ